MVKGSPDFNHQSPGLSLSPPTSEGHWSPHHRGQPDVSQPGSERPQASPVFDGHRSVNRDSEGLQTVVASSPYNSGTWQPGNGPYQLKEPEKFPSQADFQPAVIDAPKNSRRKWWHLGIAVLVAVIIILAAVLGGVLGSRAHRDATAQSPAQAENSSPSTTASSTPASPSSAAAAPPGRVRSTTGAWNGTGIATLLINDAGSQGYLFFQDATGNINQLTYNINGSTSQLTVAPATLPDCPAANGTGLSGAQIYGNAGSSFYLYYVNQRGVLAECFQNSTTTSGTWIAGPGDLSSYGFKTPTDNRPALYVVANYLDGINVDSIGFRLYAGGMDGSVYQYSFDQVSATWFDNATYNFPEAWAYGGALVADFSTSNTGVPYNRSLFLTDRSGTIQAHVQTNGYDGNTTHWPTGGQWYRPIYSPQKAAVNSSFGFANNYTGRSNSLLLFGDQNGNVAADYVSLDLWANPTTTNFNEVDTTVPNLRVMPGSDFDWEAPFGNSSLIFYQDEGTSIAWALFDKSLQRLLSSGHIRLQDNAWNVTP